MIDDESGDDDRDGLRTGPPGIPVREFPGILRKLRSVIFFPVISLFVQFHYHLQQTLSVNYNVLSINHWSIISIGTKLQFQNPLGTIFWVWADPVCIDCRPRNGSYVIFVYESHGLV